MDVLRQKRRGRRDPEHCRQGEFIGRAGGKVTVEVEYFTRLLHRIEDHSGKDRGTNRVQMEGERGHNTKIPAASAQAPEQIGVLSLAGRDKLAISRDNLS